jgi:acyl carrier protein
MEQQIIVMISEIKDDTGLVGRLNEQSNIMEDGGLDSLQLINFILKVEEQFGIEIDFDQFDFELLGSVADFCRYISERQQAASA